MQCIWHKFARDSSSGLCRVANYFSTPKLTPGFTFPHPNSLLRPNINRNISRNLSLAASPPPSRQPPLSFQSNSLSPTSKLTSTSAPLAPSRLAFAATKAVHISLREHALEDAFLIVNSIRYAALPESHRQAKSWATIKHSNINFPPGVSPRLPAHALLHGLVRFGMPQQASELATAMMNTGIRVNGKTLTTIVDGLAKAATVKNASSNASDARLKHHIESLLGTSKILTLKSSMTSDPNTALALELLHAARESGSRRTGAMFNTLITLCLINGEIIIASLLFGVLVKDWEARSQALTRMTTPPASEAPQVQPSSEDLDRAYCYSLLTSALQPTPGMLKAITVHIQERLAWATPDDADTLEFQEALQSLAILASLVDKRQLPFPQLSGIIKALVRCPTTGNWVWVTSHDRTTYVPAYHYFHKILTRLTASLPTKAPSRHTVVVKRLNRPASIRFKLVDPIQRMQPPLDHHSYNTLIHYALQSRFSPKLAKQVYEHLTVKREPPLPANQDTFNILLRSAALYKRRDLVSKSLQTFGQHVAPDAWQKIDECQPNTSRLPGRLKLAGRLNLPLPSAPAFHQIPKDNYTLATHLSSLISCGQSRLVVQFMYQLFPVLEFGHHRDLPGPMARARQRKWHESLTRAVAFGPHVLGTFLHAIVQYGVTKKAHRLFNLIVHAAKASHDPTVAGKAKPWNVSVPIYTTMLQAYKKEFKRCHSRTGTRILSYLLRKTATLYEMVKADIRHSIPEGKLDSRFYNALLKVLSEYLPIRRTSVAEASDHLEHVRQQYAKSGFIDDRGLLPLVEEVLADMEAYGYPIPIGFQHLLIGRRGGILQSVDSSPEFERRPFAFSKARRSGGPYTLPVYNTKSLTVVRRNRHTRIRKLRRAM